MHELNPKSSIRDIWGDYHETVLKPARIAPGTIQYTEMQRAFYGGFIAGICSIRDLSILHDQEEDAIAHIERLQDEISDWYANGGED